jgi:diaminopimelate decarboxylase
MTTSRTVSKLALYPISAGVSEQGHLIIGGCDSIALADEFGTPLYVFDELSLRRRCAEFKTEFGNRYPDTTVVYAGKAFINKALLGVVKDEGLGLDVVSGGELGIASSVDFPMDRVYFHGNNKSAEELGLALQWGVGRIVVDNFNELNILREIAGERSTDILLRLSPGIDPHTHRYNTTGIIDSKFGFTLSTWEEAVTGAMAAPNLNLVGLHCHLGSGIFETEPYQKAIEVVLEFAAAMRQKHGFELTELDIGGGFGVQYTLDETPPPIAAFADLITGVLTRRCSELKLALPRVVIEPGRAIVAQAGVALYRVGVIKEIPGIRCYVSVDGGMGDNIRPALYGAQHEALVANNVLAEEGGQVTIAGKFCESGDILIKDINLPPVAAGDIIAVAGCGAYCLPMSSNYNAAFRPAVVMVREGRARLIRRRETLEDLTRCDLV